jgi:hypothetical protein
MFYFKRLTMQMLRPYNSFPTHYQRASIYLVGKTSLIASRYAMPLTVSGSR